jgi:hypothetical protein
VLLSKQDTHVPRYVDTPHDSGDPDPSSVVDDPPHISGPTGFILPAQKAEEQAVIALPAGKETNPFIARPSTSYSASY